MQDIDNIFLVKRIEVVFIFLGGVTKATIARQIAYAKKSYCHSFTYNRRLNKALK